MKVLLRALVGLGTLALAGCAAPRLSSQSAPGQTTLKSAQLLAAVQSDADQIDLSKDSASRAQLLAAATLSAQQCLAQYPADAACQYAQAQVLGLTARERPLQAAALLKEMLADLAKAEGLDPALDHAGPARLSAVVLMRAPPWPLGPGDVDAALQAAQRAIKGDPTYPPNLITLAQVQVKRDGAPAGRAVYAQAQQAIRAWPVAAQRAPWQREVDQGLAAGQ